MGSELFAFTGQRDDSAGVFDQTYQTGLYYYGSRFYDPAIGRFITADSWTNLPNDERGYVVGENPGGYNQYGYVLNNPLLFNDPSGHIEDPGDDVQLTDAQTDELFDRQAEVVGDGLYDQRVTERQQQQRVDSATVYFERMADLSSLNRKAAFGSALSTYSSIAQSVAILVSKETSLEQKLMLLQVTAIAGTAYQIEIARQKLVGMYISASEFWTFASLKAGQLALSFGNDRLTRLPHLTAGQIRAIRVRNQLQDIMLGIYP